MLTPRRIIGLETRASSIHFRTSVAKDVAGRDQSCPVVQSGTVRPPIRWQSGLSVRIAASSGHRSGTAMAMVSASVVLTVKCFTATIANATNTY